MFPPARPLRALVLTACAAGPVFAQVASPAPATASGAEIQYRSSLEGYERFTDEKLRSWREVNDNVGRIGGWRTYAREGREPTGAAPKPAQPAASGAPASPADPHAGHGKQ